MDNELINDYLKAGWVKVEVKAANGKYCFGFARPDVAKSLAKIKSKNLIVHLITNKK